MSVPKLPIFITLPFIGNFSYHSKKQLHNIVKKYFPPSELIYAVFLLMETL